MHLQRDLEKVRKLLLQLGGLVKEITGKSISFVDTRADRLVSEVLSLEDTINALEVDIDEECLKILALHQPVATDLRFVVVVMKVTNDLERMGDQAVNITNRVKAIVGQPEMPVDLPMRQMCRAVDDMVSQSLTALVDQDVERARRVVEMDEAVDALHARNYELIRGAIAQSPECAGAALSFATISSNLERMGDLCTNIAEEVIFMMEGDIVRHQD